MKIEQKVSIAGMSLGGGKKENFFFCLMEFFPDKNRWFLTSLKQVREEESLDRDEVIMSWVDNYRLRQLVVDFPLTEPQCDHCDLKCPGTNNCHHPIVVEVRAQINHLIQEDEKLYLENPKKYEQERLKNEEIDYSKGLFAKGTCEHILGKSFKRKLKKGFLPYWNRPLDFWIWKNYYDQILDNFNVSYDSYGNVSHMLMKRFKYLLRHLPEQLELYEANNYINLLELYRAKIITKKQLIELQDLTLAPIARLEVIRQIEKKCKVFIYEKDLETLIQVPKAFGSFLLAVAGQALVLNSVAEIPNFGEKENHNFIAPYFS